VTEETYTEGDFFDRFLSDEKMTMSSGKGTLCIQPSCPGHKVSKKGKSYALRECSIKKRKETERRKNQPRKRGPKPRPKSAPMSKYRRKTANLRERLRMGEINTAFENLREKLPNPVQSGKGKCEKLTKINILHVTINYIRAMENLLETGDSGVRSFSDMVKNPLRDENDSKIEMQRILKVLMKKAEAKAAAAAGMPDSSGLESELRQHGGRSRKFGTESQNGLFNNGAKEKFKSEIKLEFDEDDDDEDDDDDDDNFEDDLSSFDNQDEIVNNVGFPDWKSLSSTLHSFPISGVQPLPTSLAAVQTFPKPCSSSTPKAAAETHFVRSSSMISTPTLALTNSSQHSFSSTSSSPSTLSISSSDSGCLIVKRQPDPLFSSLTFEPGNGGGPPQNSDEMIKEFFTDFVDMVDTLPDIDFEEHFEMFP